jgi:uncharacterized protein YerC
MSKPKTEVQEDNYYRDIHFFYQIISDLKELDLIKKFLKDILSPAELRMIKRRWHIASTLLDGRWDVRNTASITKTSTATVIKIKNILENGNGGLKIAIEHMKKKIERERENYIKSKRRGGSKFVKSWFD